MNRVLAVLMSVKKLKCFLFLSLLLSSFSIYSANYYYGTQAASNNPAAYAACNAVKKPWPDACSLRNAYFDAGTCNDSGNNRIGSAYKLISTGDFYFYCRMESCPPGQERQYPSGQCTPPTCTSPSFKKGKSVDAETGNQYQEVDYLSDGLSPLKLSRYFNSTDTTLSSFGMGWRGAYSRSLNLSDDVVEVIRDDGKSLTFNLVAGFWLPEKNVNAQLLQTASGWTYFSGSNELETYNSSGQLSSITDHSGLATTLHYDVEGHLVSVVNPLGRSLSFAYTDSLVNFVTVADGTVYQYVYDANRLVKVIYPDQRFRRYLYENSQNPQVLTGVVDGKGKHFAAKSDSVAIKGMVVTPGQIQDGIDILIGEASLLGGDPQGWVKRVPRAPPKMYRCRYFISVNPPDVCPRPTCPIFATGEGVGLLKEAYSKAFKEAHDKIPPTCVHQHHGQAWCREGNQKPFWYK
jgi:hypothetical protein